MSPPLKSPCFRVFETHEVRVSKKPTPPQAPAVGLFFFLVLGGIAEIVLHPPLHRAGKKKPHYQIDSGVSFICLVGREGLEPATKGL